jgi:hypothetical protein
VKLDVLKRINGESYASDWRREMIGIFREGMNTWRR